MQLEALGGILAGLLWCKALPRRTLPRIRPWTCNAGNIATGMPHATPATTHCHELHKQWTWQEAFLPVHKAQGHARQLTSGLINDMKISGNAWLHGHGQARWLMQCTSLALPLLGCRAYDCSP